jgi:tetratricopeptide (TPR) repeat protein
LPLALRVAGARLAARPAQAIDSLVTELADEQDRLAVLATEDADTSVEAALRLSYRALPAAAARLFQLLGLHPGTTIDLPTASALAGTDHTDTRRVLKTLTAAHLVAERTPGRYARHDLVRLYTRHLAVGIDAGDTAAARGRLLDHYYETADSYARILAGQATPPAGHDPAEPVTWIRHEAETIRALVRDAARQHNRRTWQLAYSATFLYGLCHDGAPWWDTLHLGVDAASADGDDEGLANMLRRLAFEEELAGDLESSIEHTAAAIDRTHGSSVPLLRIDLARRLAVVGRTTQALDRLAEAQAGAGDETQPARQATLHNGIAWVLVLCEQPEPALAHARQALELVGDHGVYPLHASAAHTYGRALEKLGRFDEAVAAYRQAAGWAAQLGNPRRQAFNAADLGRLLARLGRAAEARPELESALRLYSRLGLPEADALRDELAGLDRVAPAATTPATGHAGAGAATGDTQGVSRSDVARFVVAGRVNPAGPPARW